MQREMLNQHPPAKFGFLARLSRGPKRSVLLVREHRTAAKTKPKPEIGRRCSMPSKPGSGKPSSVVDELTKLRSRRMRKARWR